MRTYPHTRADSIMSFSTRKRRSSCLWVSCKAKTGPTPIIPRNSSAQMLDSFLRSLHLRHRRVHFRLSGSKVVYTPLPRTLNLIQSFDRSHIQADTSGFGQLLFRALLQVVLLPCALGIKLVREFRGHFGRCVPPQPSQMERLFLHLGR